MGTPNTIFIEAADRKPLVREKLAAGAMTPGNLVERVAGGFQRHSSAGGASQKLFALENIADAGTIDRDYAVGETSRAGYALNGDLVYGLVAAGAAAIADGVALESAGDGTLRVLAAGVIVGYAAEAVDNSGGGTVVRIKLEVA